MDTPSTLRAAFPEFDNVRRYPDTLITFWQTLAYKLLPANVWGDLLSHGVGLFTAHHLVLSAKARASSAVQGGKGASPVPGISTGAISSKSVDKVSISYDTSAISIKDAGQWNGTEYGIQFYQLVKIVGAQGAMQLNGPNIGGSYVGPF